MKHHLRLVWLRLAFFLMLARFTLYSAELLTGKWNCSGNTPHDEDVQFVLDLKQSGEKVTGTLTVGDDTFDILEGSIQGNHLEIVTDINGSRYVSSAIVENNRVTGSWKNDGGQTGHWEGQRQTGNGKLI